MAESTRNAADSVWGMAKRRLIGIIIAVSVVILLVFAAWSITLLGTWTALLISAASMLAIFFLAPVVTDPLVDRFLHAKWGAQAEGEVAAMLECLGDDYRVFHDVESKFGNIDHLLIRRDGAIIVVETKGHRGRVKIVGDDLRHGNGKQFEKNFIKQTLSNIYAMRDHIGANCEQLPWITGIIVFTRAFVEARAPVKGITVCNVKYLLKAISKAKPNPAYAQMLWDQWQISAAKLN